MARHSLLAEAARGLGAKILLFGHTLDDQIETFLIRAQSGSGWRGLAGMRPASPSPVWPEGRGLRVLRPLLGYRRDALRAFLMDQDQRWIEDPSNENLDYTRVRMRQWLAGNPEACVRIIRIQAKLAGLREIDDQALAHDAKNLLVFDGYGAAQLDWNGFCELPPARAVTLLTYLITCVSDGRAFRPMIRSDPCIDRFNSEAETTIAQTLHGAWLKRSGDRLDVLRDPGGVAPIDIKEDGDEAVFDSRFVIDGEGVSDRATEIRPLKLEALTEGGRDRAKAIPHDRRQTLPVIRDASGMISMPHIGLGPFHASSLVESRFWAFLR